MSIKFDFLNLRTLSIMIFKYFGIASPSQQQVNRIQELISFTIISDHYSIHENLSKKERQVLFFVSNGISFQEIADLMQIKVNTVQTYSKRIKRKLVCRTLAHAVFIGINGKKI